MSEHSPLTPEARALDDRVHRATEAEWFGRLGAFKQTREVLRRIFVGVYTDGFVHAGNFAYMSLVTLFAFCVVAAAIAGGLGQTGYGLRLIGTFFETVPAGVADTLRDPIMSAMTARTGPLLWMSALVGLWTVTSLVETIRDVMHRSYGTTPDRSFLQYRAGSLIGVVFAVILAMVAFSAQVLVIAAEELVYRYLPFAENAAGYFAWGRIIPFVMLFTAIYMIFVGLTPRKYRPAAFPKWPGAVLVSLWWLGCTSVLPWFVTSMADYDLAYGSLAGVMVALIFFYLIGLGMVTGAQLNAALANAAENVLRDSES